MIVDVATKQTLMELASYKGLSVASFRQTDIGSRDGPIVLNCTVRLVGVRPCTWQPPCLYVGNVQEMFTL